ncbi:MAG: DUF2298 domain-containing protein [bacterium]
MKPSRKSAILIALFACLCVAVIGNLAGFLQLLQTIAPMQTISGPFGGFIYIGTLFTNITKIAAGQVKFEYNYWDPTRVIPGTINEFPYFSFLFADLHPHMIAIPFTLLVLALLLNLFLKPKVELLTPDAPSTTLDDLEIPKRMQTLLAAVDIHTQNDLLRHTREQLLELSGIGEKTVDHIEENLTTHNLTLGQDITNDNSSSLFPDIQASLKENWYLIPVLGLATGALLVINSWDFPVYGLFVLLFFLIESGIFNVFELTMQWIRTKTLPTQLAQAAIKTTVQAFTYTILISIIGYILFIPFFLAFQNPTKGVGINNLFTTPQQYFAVFGFYLFIITSFLLIHIRRILKTLFENLQENTLPRFDILIIGLFLITFFLKFWSLALFIILSMVATIIVIFSNRNERGKVFGLLLALVGFAITLGTEIIYLKDHMDGGDYKRMNTIFKFYNQAWILFAISAAILVYFIFKELYAKQPQPQAQITDQENTENEVPIPPQRLPWKNAVTVVFSSMFTLLFAAALVYPAFGTGTKINNRFPEGPYPPATLDSLAFMKTGIYTWPEPTDKIVLSYELEAIEYLNNTIIGNPVIMEIGGAIGFYREMAGRVSSFTGLPTLSGFHENEQRDVGKRPEETRAVYETSSWEKAKKILDKYNVQYIYVGQVEKNAIKETGEKGLSKFDQQIGQDLSLEFQNEKVKIYKITR